MSKAMAIEGVGKIFIMIAVLVVGIAFLVKALGIDPFGWLEKKFEGIDVPETGKALHVRMDVDAKLKDVFSFHLLSDNEMRKHHTDEEGSSSYYSLYFQIESDKVKNPLVLGNCVLLVTEEEKSSFGIAGGADKSYVYYIKSGTMIQDDDKPCQFLGQCLSDKNWDYKKLVDKGYGCISDQVRDENPSCDKCKKAAAPSYDCIGPFSVVNCAGQVLPGPFGDWQKSPPCDSDHTVIKNFEFSDDILISDRCAEDDPSECNLLNYREVEGKSIFESKRFIGSKVKYGIICGNDGYWHTCKQNIEGEVPTPDGTYTCDSKLGGAVFYWKK